MKKSILVPVFAVCVLLFASCQEPAKTDTAAETAAAMPEATVTDPAQVRADIVAVEQAWQDAMNKKDVNALMAMYADGAESLQNDGPTLVGKAAIQKQQEAEFAAPAKYASIAFETTDVYAQGDYVTEVGKTMYKDADGKVTSSGKYMVVFEKKDGKYLCLREIYNSDSK